MRLKGTKVLIVGLGKTGVSLVKFLCARGAEVTVSDIRTKAELAESLDEIRHLPFRLEAGKHGSRTFLNSDLIIMSPGVPLAIKQVNQAKRKGKPILSEIEFASHFIKIPIIAVTGTNGKTTTTTLIGEILKASGKKVFVGGNIGLPLMELCMSDKKEQIAVVEVSSFQLEGISQFRPQGSLLLNLTPDHQDRYIDFNAYRKAKMQIFKNQTTQDYAVLNASDPWMKELASQLSPHPYFFGFDELPGKGVRFADGKIVVDLFDQKEEYSTEKMFLRGRHNKENFMAAIVISRLFGGTPEAIQKTIVDFPGVAHRLEYVTTKEGVAFYNDSKATNLDSATRSLESFEEPLILIAGGRDKGADFRVLRPLVKKKVKTLIFFGEAKEKMSRMLGDLTETFVLGTLEEAVILAYKKSHRGSVVLLSPACASFDLYKNFEERGNHFKKLVKELE